MRPYLLLHVFFVVYAVSSVFSKLAGLSSGQSFLSFEFCLYYALSLCCLMIFTLGWQRVLSVLPLSVAYTHKGVLLLWGMLAGYLIFDEPVTVKQFLAIGIVLCGIYLCSAEGRRHG